MVWEVVDWEEMKNVIHAYSEAHGEGSFNPRIRSLVRNCEQDYSKIVSIADKADSVTSEL